MRYSQFFINAADLALLESRDFAIEQVKTAFAVPGIELAAVSVSSGGQCWPDLPAALARLKSRGEG